MVAGPVSRFDVSLVALDPTVGSEIQKTRPCLVVSPDELNRHLATETVAPVTTQGRPYPSRVHCRFQGTDGWVVLDQLRSVDKIRLVRRLGRRGAPARRAVLAVLAELCAEEPSRGAGSTAAACAQKRSDRGGGCSAPRARRRLPVPV